MKIQLRKIDASLDKQIITGMIVSGEFLDAIRHIYKPDLLMVDYAVTVAGWCIEYWHQYGKAPKAHIQDIFFARQRQGLNEDLSEAIEGFLANISGDYEKGEDLNIPYLIDEAKKLFQKRDLEQLKEGLEYYLSHGECEEALAIVKSYKPVTFEKATGKGFTARELMEMDIPEIRWVIEGVIPEGLTLFAGKPKVGKSFFLLDAGLAIATGNNAFNFIPTEPADVLYLALEDPIARIKDRLNKMLGYQPAPERLHIYPLGEWPRAHEGGMEALEAWMEKHPQTRLVIIDTLERFKKPQKTPGYHYGEDYKSLQGLHAFANSHQIGVIVVHHTKKASTKDPFDEISGTTGLTAVPDTLAKLDRTATGKEGRLFAYRGRDVGEEEMVFRFNQFRYELSPDEAEQYQGSESRQNILRYLYRVDGPVPRKELVELMEKWGVGKGVDTLLQKMVSNEDVLKLEYGKYAHGKYDNSYNTWRPELNQRIKEHLNKHRK